MKVSKQRRNIRIRQISVRGIGPGHTVDVLFIQYRIQFRLGLESLALAGKIRPGRHQHDSSGKQALLLFQFQHQ